MAARLYLLSCYMDKCACVYLCVCSASLAFFARINWTVCMYVCVLCIWVPFVELCNWVVSTHHQYQHQSSAVRPPPKQPTPSDSDSHPIQFDDCISHFYAAHTHNVGSAVAALAVERVWTVKPSITHKPLPLSHSLAPMLRACPCVLSCCAESSRMAGGITQKTTKIRFNIKEINASSITLSMLH